MLQGTDRLKRILTLVILALFAVLVIQQIYFSVTEGGLSSAKSELESVNSQISDAQSQNDNLTKQQSEKLIEYKNAQGRLSLSGDGSGKVAYLTFDDGPSKTLTKKNLEVLTEHGAVATWFCLADEEDYPYLDLSLCKDIEAQGSAVGIHDWDQNDSYDYYKGTAKNYFTSDFNKAKSAIESAVGHEIHIMRFAGGSLSIKSCSSSNAKKIPKMMLKRGIQFVDWNVLAGDSESSQFVNGSTPKSKIVSNVLSEAQKYAKTNSPICVLMHDNPGKETTTKALPEIIDGLKELGYTFKTLDFDSPGFYQLEIG
ncbi:MAG: polysaccharide deacetylase family protein [Coriobacteriales bacterium]|jgi:peptidoglycan/xylan/chitin deacetylase (PgdA/CDA1 family)